MEMQMLAPAILFHFLHLWLSYVTYQGKASAFAEAQLPRSTFLIKIQRRIFLFSLTEIK
jgi:hypothetical protein